MLWDAQELKMDGGTFDAYTGMYNVPSEPKTWDQQCPSLVTADPLLEPDEYEDALVKVVKNVSNVQSCPSSFLSQFWQQRCRDIDYSTAQRNCEATCVMDGDCLDHPVGGPPGPWVCRAGQAAPACVSRCEQAVQRLNDECFFMSFLGGFGTNAADEDFSFASSLLIKEFKYFCWHGVIAPRDASETIRSNNRSRTREFIVD